MCHARGQAMGGRTRQQQRTAGLTTVSLFWGMCIWTFLGGIVTTLLIHLNAASSEYTAKITALNQYMAHRHLPQVDYAFSWPHPVVPRCKSHTKSV